MDQGADERLRQLGNRIDAARLAAEPPPRAESHHAMANMAWRMVIELVAGIGIGVAIGYGLDTLAGTMPIFLVVFLLLGLAAGVRTMMRTAAEIGAGAPGATDGRTTTAPEGDTTMRTRGSGGERD